MSLMTESTTDERIESFRREVDHRFEAVNARFEAVDQRFDQVNQRFDAMDQRFDRVEAGLREHRAEFVAIRKEIKAGFDSMNRTLFGAAVLVVVTLIGLAAT